jgi:hypothetical protein
MKKSITSLIIIALGLLACLVWLVWLGSRPDAPLAESVSNTSRGQSFEVRVVMPRSGLPLGGILPDWVVGKLDGTCGYQKLDPGSRTLNLISIHTSSLIAPRTRRTD